MNRLDDPLLSAGSTSSLGFPAASVPLEKFGFKFSSGGAHVSRTMMLAELRKFRFNKPLQNGLPSVACFLQYKRLLLCVSKYMFSETICLELSDIGGCCEAQEGSTDERRTLRQSFYAGQGTGSRDAVGRIARVCRQAWLADRGRVCGCWCFRLQRLPATARRHDALGQDPASWT